MVIHTLMRRKLKRSLKRFWREWLQLPALVGITVTVTVFIVLMIWTSVSSSDRTAESTHWPPQKSVVVKHYLNFSTDESFILTPKRDSISNDEYCTVKDKILILVASSPNRFEARKVIRQTWGAKENLHLKHIKILFVMGQSDDRMIEYLVKEEAKQHNDIIQEKFADSYYHQTLKTLAMLKWINLTCAYLHTGKYDYLEPQWMLKSRDNTYVNVDRLLEITKSMPYSTMIGHRKCGVRPEDDEGSKFYMPKYLYRWPVFPGYLLGDAYLMKAEIIPILIENTEATPLIHLEDVYITGILPRRSYIFPDESPYFSSEPFTVDLDFCTMMQMATLNQVSPEKMKIIAQRLKEPPQTNCQTKKIKRRRGGGRYLKMTEKERKLCLIPKAKQKFYEDEDPEVYDGYGYFGNF